MPVAVSYTGRKGEDVSGAEYSHGEFNEAERRADKP